MAKKKKEVTKQVNKTESLVQEVELVQSSSMVEEDIQYTDTSYTSASFESLPAVVVLEEVKQPKKKKKKKDISDASIKKSSDLFQWSEDTLPDIEEETTVAEGQVEEKKKRGKKKKKPEEAIPDFEKPKNWKTMAKKERETWLTQQIDNWKAEKEAEKQAKLAGAKEKRITEARMRNELMASDIAEQEIRNDLLRETVRYFQKFEKHKMDFDTRKLHNAEWQQYLRCDGLPDPRVLTQMNTYIHLWSKQGWCDDNELSKRCNEVLPMLELLEELVANPRLYTPHQAQGYNEVRLNLRAHLAKAIQLASYTLLRDLEKNLNFESTKLATYKRVFKELRLNLWVAIKWPTKKPLEIEPEREPMELEFPAIKVGVKLPKSIDASCVCVRAARSTIDLLSESSRTFGVPGDIQNRYQDLFEFNEIELREVQKLKKEQDELRRTFYRDVNAKIKEIENLIKTNPYIKLDKEKDELDNLNLAEPPFLPDPRTHIGDMNELAFQKYLKLCKTRTRTGEINLRKYRICGGVLHLDLLTTPPQPKRMRNSVIATTLQLPKTLQPVKYQVQYRAPGPPPPGVVRTPEEIEASIKKVEAQYEKLALVTIDLPQDVLWHEPPQICQWQESRKLWTINYVNDFKYNEDKLSLQFRTGVLWPIGIATLRYSNMPYQGWDVKPDPDGKGVLITVTGVSVTVTWLCHSNHVKLRFIANATTPALKDQFEKPYSVKKMVQMMREAACDFFPEFDAHSHIEGTCHKEWVMERHTYHAMAHLSMAYNFQWSRWNVEAGHRIAIMQFREAVDTKRENKLQLLYVTPQRATVLKCNEMSQEFSDEPSVGLGFYPDLFTLNLSYGSVDARRVCFNMKYKLVETVFEMLQELKVLSFS